MSIYQGESLGKGRFVEPGVRIPPSAIDRLLQLRAALGFALFDDLQFLPQLDDAGVRENAAKVYAWINHAVAADDRTGVDHRVTTDFGAIADDRSEFSEPC